MSYRHILLSALLLFVCAIGCDQETTQSEPKTAEEEESKDFIDSEATLEEKRYLEATRPWIIALAERNYSKIYSHLSSHARSQMSLNQFNPATDDAKYEELEKKPLKNITEEKFIQLMQNVETQYGVPYAPKNLYVQSLDPAILNRQGKDEYSALDSMFAIGAMPDSIPATIRRASVRGQVLTQFSPTTMAEMAKSYNIPVEEIKPYFNVKLVLIEEEGTLKIGYFEFLPPSMMD